MKTSIQNVRLSISLGGKVAIVIALMFANMEISAQQKFTIQLTNGLNKQVQVDGLKLTFDNNGVFSCWQNGVKQDMTFSSVGKIYFTDLSLPTKNFESISQVDALKVYPNPTTGIITLEFTQNSGIKTEVSVLNVIGAEVFRMELDNMFSYQIDLSNQVNGIYLLKVFIDNRQYISKIVIRKE
jgi:hypothetical protein